ncbi:tubulin epsilon and delta complex protein 1 isoform X4 [Chelmon rostratus]|uniref:tubulin epsilon and delta complex protein 1 isoform X4 n=1 Tax=Chelmon rostratus TaxID=109905 RepID=UPI001BE7DCDD|nr:tubulin epsilon and delta complex protein 1 isoform X4 [Chelmon rostratus]
MQRSKAAVSVQVKQVIGALCELLVATGLEVVPLPETFRRAKFGGGRLVEDQFWHLLANILQAAGIVSCEAPAQPRGASEHRKLVAAGLWLTGYHANWMCGREGGEGGEGERFTSRDLLLALGWLLATGTLEKLLTQQVQQLDKTLLTPTPVNAQLSSKLQLDSSSMRKLQWLIGCLRCQGQTLLSMQEERTRLLHAVLFAAVSSAVCSDQSSTLLQEDCLCMQQLCDLLEAYLNWKKVEKVFWTWMFPSRWQQPRVPGNVTQSMCVCVGQCGGLPPDRSCCRDAYTCTQSECKTVSPWKPGAKEIGGDAVKTAYRTGRTRQHLPPSSSLLSPIPAFPPPSLPSQAPD